MIHHALARSLQLPKRRDLVNEANAISFFHVKAFSGKRVTPYLADSDGIVELWDNDGSGHADAHLGNRKHSVIGGNHNVTSGDHSDTATETGTLHQRESWNREGVEPRDRLCAHPRGRQIILRRPPADRVPPIAIRA